MEKITELKVCSREIPLSIDFPTSYKHPFREGQGRVTHHVFVRLSAGDLTGYGEGTELTMFTGGTSRTMEEIIREHFTEVILGCTIGDAFRVFREVIMRHPHNPGAKLGVEMALYDLLGKARAVPLYELLGRRMRDEIPLCHAIGALSPARAAEQARDAIEAGFRTIKLKANGDIPKDLERINAVLEVMPQDGRLRVDANQGWETFRRAGEALRELAWNHRIEYIEQPVHRERIADMRKLSDRYGVPIFADESIHTPQEARRMLQEDLVDGICIKVAKCGSLADGKLIADMAALHGVPVTPVCAFATSLGAMAELHMTTTVPLLSSAIDMGPWKLKEDFSRPRLQRAPILPIPETHGIGAELEIEF